jgi:ADP-ribosylglycohydrolase
MIPPDYLERVYAGVLGKIIGVYLGRPFEGWSYQRILSELGPISYYVNDRLGKPIVVTDDDISGTFTFVRALVDFGSKITAAEIGETWLNYIVEGRTTLWWGGLGNSTEHTAFLRLKQGTPAPASGSISVNGKTVAEQIGAQIFIDAWAMVTPGNPQSAAEFAGKAASVSHDGEATFAAQLLAAMESLAFVESDINRLLDGGLSFIPADSLVARVVKDIRTWHKEDADWTKTRARIDEVYGYAKFPGNCHIIPNHAIVILSLLYCDDDFQKALMIANTSGWDTDCNSGNVGCLMGIKNGLAAIDSGPDWRSPVRDRMLISSADGARAITDAVSQTYEIVSIGSALQGGITSPKPKDGARFHFELPGSVQGFHFDDLPSGGGFRLENVEGHSNSGRRSLAIRFTDLPQGRPLRVATPTFMTPEQADESHYMLMASPTLYPGQTLRAGLFADELNSVPLICRPYVCVHDHQNRLRYGPAIYLPAQTPGIVDAASSCVIEGSAARKLRLPFQELLWKIEDCNGYPIAEAGLEICAEEPGSGTVYLDYLDWNGMPQTSFPLRAASGKMFQRSWVNAIDQVRWLDALHLSHPAGTGLFFMGGHWRNYVVNARLVAQSAHSFGLVARIRGLRRYYAFTLSNRRCARILKRMGDLKILEEVDYTWSFNEPHQLTIEVEDCRISGSIDGKRIVTAEDNDAPLSDGGFGFLCEEGSISSDQIAVAALPLRE